MKNERRKKILVDPKQTVLQSWKRAALQRASRASCSAVSKAPPATAAAEGTSARGGWEGAGLRAASGRGALSYLSPPWIPSPFPPPHQSQSSPWYGAGGAFPALRPYARLQDGPPPDGLPDDVAPLVDVVAEGVEACRC